MNENVSTEGLKPEAVLAALYNATRPIGMGVLHFDPAQMTDDEAAALLSTEGPYFDYLNGRVMKVRIPGPDDPQEFRAAMYDRDNGEGAAERVVAALRAKADA
jgi:hypothetical protein